jgi:hypothetical protein
MVSRGACVGQKVLLEFTGRRTGFSPTDPVSRSGPRDHGGLGDWGCSATRPRGAECGVPGLECLVPGFWWRVPDVWCRCWSLSGLERADPSWSLRPVRAAQSLLRHGRAGMRAVPVNGPLTAVQGPCWDDRPATWTRSCTSRSQYVGSGMHPIARSRPQRVSRETGMDLTSRSSARGCGCPSNVWLRCFTGNGWTRERRIIAAGLALAAGTQRRAVSIGAATSYPRWMGTETVAPVARL